MERQRRRSARLCPIIVVLALSAAAFAGPSTALHGWDHCVLYIDSEADLYWLAALGTGGWDPAPQDGSPENPYVIDGDEIKPGEPCQIDISDTTAHFILRDFVVQPFWQTENALQVSDVQNAHLTDLVIEGATWIMGTDDVTLTRSHLDPGATLFMHGNHDLTIYDNAFPSGFEPEAYADTGLSWSVPPRAGTNIVGGATIAGNHWADYDGSDLDGDGIGETPHEAVDPAQHYSNPSPLAGPPVLPDPDSLFDRHPLTDPNDLSADAQQAIGEVFQDIEDMRNELEEQAAHADQTVAALLEELDQIGNAPPRDGDWPEPLSGNGTVHAPIHINGDDDLVAQAASEGWPGQGTPDDPILIGPYWIYSTSTIPVQIDNTNLSVAVVSSYLDAVGDATHAFLAHGNLDIGLYHSHVFVHGPQSGAAVEVFGGWGWGGNGKFTLGNSSLTGQAQSGINVWGMDRADMGKLRLDMDVVVALESFALDNVVHNSTIIADGAWACAVNYPRLTIQDSYLGACDTGVISGWALALTLGRNTLAPTSAGVWSFGDDVVEIRDNQIRPGGPEPHDPAGLILEDPTRAHVEGNHIQTASAGISLDNSGWHWYTEQVVIESNRIEDSGLGIRSVGTHAHPDLMVRITNNTVRDSLGGLSSFNAAPEAVRGNTFDHAESIIGLNMAFEDNHLIGGNTSLTILYGDLQVRNNVIEQATVGIRVAFGLGIDIQHNHIVGNQLGLLIEGSRGTKIYDNRFVNQQNALVAENPHDPALDPDDITWWVFPRGGPNIVGGPKIGGNHWCDYTHDDMDLDGFGDRGHDIPSRVVREAAYDQYPLVAHVLGEIPALVAPLALTQCSTAESHP